MQFVVILRQIVSSIGIAMQVIYRALGLLHWVKGLIVEQWAARMLGANIARFDAQHARLMGLGA
eukprot:2075949-Amphidinium_carterae.1